MSRSGARVKGPVSRADRWLMRRSAAVSVDRADTLLKRIARSADYNRLWFGTATVLALRTGSTRRAGLRGVGAIAATSTLVNFAAKRLLVRRRPAAALVARRRRLDPRPTSSSFPSGHAASAAAFTTAVTLENPALGLALCPVAAAVAYSRVHTGVHWPSDVAVGAALGACLGLATRHWWPVHSTVPSMARHQAPAPALPEGTGLVMLVNPSSGDDGNDPTDGVAARWPNATLVWPRPGRDLSEQLGQAVDRQPERVRAVGVAGGDGTVAAAASVAAERELPLAVVPAGTLNHFVRDVGVNDLDDADRAITEGTAIHVASGGVAVDDDGARCFVNTASLGGYPEMVRLREQWEHRWGKWPAGAAALIRVLAKAEPLNVRLNGHPHRLWLVFVGNGGYQPKGFAPSWRPHLDDGVLDVRYVRADVRCSRIRFVFAAVSGALFNSRTYVQREYRRIDIDVAGEPVALACDGEVGMKGHRFTFTAHGKALRVYRPDDTTSAG